MTVTPHVGVSPLPRIRGIDGSFQLHMPTLHQVVTKIAATGFNAKEIDLPSGMAVPEYGRLLLGAAASSPLGETRHSGAMCLDVTTHCGRVRA